MELMEVGGDYRATADQPKPPSEPPPEADVQKPKPKKAIEKSVKEKKPVKERKPVEQRQPVKEEKPVKERKPSREEKQYSTEALLTAGDGKIRVLLNYPLAAMFCFMAIVIVICAVLVGWRLGRDAAEQRYREWLDERVKISKHELAESPDDLDE